MDDDRPPILCLVAYPLAEVWTEPALVDLETAAELHRHGWIVLVDPSSEEELTRWEQAHRWLKKIG